MSAHKPCRPGPGKFEGESALTALAHWYANNGASDEDIGRYSFFRAPLEFASDPEALTFVEAQGFCAECTQAALDRAVSVYGIATWESDTGFAMISELDNEQEYNEAIEAATDDESENE